MELAATCKRIYFFIALLLQLFKPENEWPEMDAKKFDKVWLGQLKIIEELIEPLPFVFWTAKTAT